jgi:hypothetical protein
MDLQAEYANLKAENARLETSMSDIIKELSDGVGVLSMLLYEANHLMASNKSLVF